MIDVTYDSANAGELVAFINRDLVVQSLLYDLNLLPEQVQEGTEDWHKMLNIAAHFLCARQDSETTGL